MVNIKEVSTFCNMVSTNFGARFNTQRTLKGLNVVGEFYTRTGQLVTLMLDVDQNAVKTKVYNPQRRLIYNDSTKNIMSNNALMVFLQKTYVS